MEHTDTSLESFEAKWSAARPEFGLALRFVGEPQRAAHSAFACLVFEIEHAAFAIREMQPAAVKLQWWAEEFARTTKGEVRHPLTRALSERIVRAGIPLERWQEAIVGAFAQRDPEPAPTGADLLAGYAKLYVPLGAIEALLFATDAKAVAGLLTVERALRETAALHLALRDGKLPLPLDFLAMHRLARGDLAQASVARSNLLREWLDRLGGELRGLVGRPSTVVPKDFPPIPGSPLGVARAVMAAVNGQRAAEASRASEPLAALGSALGRLSLRDTWSAWRAARRSRS